MEVVGGRLVRICPDCKQSIGERTDEQGLVSDNDHWEAEHAERPPKRERCYLLALDERRGGEPGPDPHASRNLSRLILDFVEKQMSEVDWALVRRLEDLPEGAPVLLSYEVLRGSWQMKGDDPQLRRVRWYRREEESLVFTPTKAQLEEWTALRDKAANVRAALIERHRDELPTFDGHSVAEWDSHYEVLAAQEDEIAKEFDVARDQASREFYSGDYRWEATLTAAIAELGIPEEEVEALRLQRQASLAKAESLLKP